MKNFLKLWILGVAVLVGILQGEVAYAANDSFTNATGISVNTKVTDKIASSSDENYYKFTLAKDGYISISVTHAELEQDSCYWYVYLYNSSRECIALSGRSYMGVYGADTSTKSCNIGLPAGTYYVKVDGPYEYWKSIDYGVTVNYTESTSWEKEFNNGYTTAETLQVNQKKYGSIRCGDDEDYYKFTLAKDGYINILFEHTEMAQDSCYWYVYLYNSSRECIALSGRSYMGVYGADTSTKSCNIGLPAGTYYVKVDGPYEYWKSIDYGLTVNYTESTVWETEFNGAFTSADEIQVNQKKYGSIRSDNDEDYYKFTLAKDGYVGFRFEHAELASSSCYWYVYLYNSNRDRISLSDRGYLGIYGNQVDTWGNLIYLSAGTYYVIVDGPYEYWENIDYGLTVNYYEHKEVTDAAVAATCTTDGWTEGSHCELCGEVMKAQERIPALGHQWDAGVVTVQPTAVSPGVKTYTCTVCGAQRGEDVPTLIPAAVGTMLTDPATNGMYQVVDSNPASTAVSLRASLNQSATAVQIPASIAIDGIEYKVVSIADNAFAGNKALVKVTIGKNVASIGKKAFYGCKKLKTVVIKTKLLTTKNVGAKAFGKINGKAVVKVPKASAKGYKKLLKKKGITGRNQKIK